MGNEGLGLDGRSVGWHWRKKRHNAPRCSARSMARTRGDAAEQSRANSSSSASPPACGTPCARYAHAHSSYAYGGTQFVSACTWVGRVAHSSAGSPDYRKRHPFVVAAPRARCCSRFPTRARARRPAYAQHKNVRYAAPTRARAGALWLAGGVACVWDISRHLSDDALLPPDAEGQAAQPQQQQPR